ncbi:uncharacterized protein LOC117111585 [Anneissia japonica]|uniref:uncharacterized protein LOC117111585 n=1 Tax=Anneissia japonica TaxID=1529436 RepID=UPI0014259F6B|nr:uncharacterized protein LOC117111585 [Anneissia japonica]
MRRSEDTTLENIFSSTLRESLHSTQSISGRTSILTYANKQYPSATDALQAYINDFEHKQLNSPYRRTVEDLLSPKSVLLQTVERSLATGVRDTSAETQRHRIKKLIDESYNEIQRADLEQDKAKQLIESSKELHRISSSDISGLTPEKTLQPQQSLTSLSTDTLLFQASQSELNHKLGFKSETDSQPSVAWNSTPLSPLQESYKANAIQLRSLQGDAGSWRNSGILKKHPSPEKRRGYREVSFTGHAKSEPELGLRNVQDRLFKHTSTGRNKKSPQSAGYKARSVDSLANQKTSFGKNSTKLRFTDESILSGGRMTPSWIEDLDRSEISTKVPHSSSHVQKTGFTSKMLSDDARMYSASEVSGHRSIPSWIQDISLSEIQNTGEGRSHIGRPPPSWINDLDDSAINSVIPTVRPVSFDSQNVLSKRGRSTPEPNFTKGDRFLPLGLTHQDLDSSSTSFNKENNSDSNGNGRTHIRSSAEINRLVRNAKSKRDSRGIRTFAASSPVAKKKLSTDMLSMTTDDLILAPSSGRGLPASRSMEELRRTLKQMEWSSSKSTGRGSPRSNRARSQNSQRSTSPLLKQQWQRHQKHKPMSDSQERSRLNISDLYSTPSKYSSRRFEQDRKQPHIQDNSLKSRWMVDEDVIPSQSHSKYYSPPTGRFTNSRGSSAEYEQRVIARAEKILGSPLTRPLQHLQTQSPDTEDILDGDRSWEKAVPPYKPLRPVYARDAESKQKHIIDRFLDDCLNSNSTSPRLTASEQPGPVEALKNMLFTIQSVAIANDLTEDDDKEMVHDDTIEDEVAPKVDSSKKLDLLTSDGDNQPEATIDGIEEGSKSLKRAMEHLSRLKYLVRSDSEQNMSDNTQRGMIE